MNKWEYAVGHFSPIGEWVEDEEVRPHFEQAVADLPRAHAAYGNEDWLAGSPLRIVKRCERYPKWQPVNDHAAEVLAEVLADLARGFRRIGQSVPQGDDLFASAVAAVRELNSNFTDPQEFDS